MWGLTDDPKGTQCTEVTKSSGKTIAWVTNFNWGGSRYQVKSFANAALSFAPVQMSKVKSMPTALEYKYQSDGSTITNVAYDMFLSSTQDGKYEYELMVWLTVLGGAAPLSRTYDPMVPIKSNVVVDNVTFNLYEGMNGKVTVYTYVATKNTNSFKADLKNFVKNLPNPKVLDNQYLLKAETGTEPFQGKGTFTVSAYSLEIIS
jgi:xyloglucan-specific endo-beta-1,4-glucanase